MVELYGEFFAMLRLAKNLYDYGMEKELKKWFGGTELDGDYYWELAYEAISWAFQDTRQYYNENEEMETWLFMDPIIDRFCQLCQEYETRRGISEEENPYRKDMERTLHEGFNFNSYSYGYDWRLSPTDRGRKCLLLYTGCDFYNNDEVPTGLMDIRDGFETMIARLETELSKETRIIPLSLVTGTQWKEAA